MLENNRRAEGEIQKLSTISGNLFTVVNFENRTIVIHHPDIEEEVNIDCVRTINHRLVTETEKWRMKSNGT